jgi:hypothetical protein
MVYTYNISNSGASGTSASVYTTSGMNGTSGQYLTSGVTGSNRWNASQWTIGSNTSSNPSSLQVTGNAEFEGDVKIKGVSIANALEDIQKRLAILVPDPAKLEHFEALKKAYEHYKVLEALCQLPITDNKE